MAKGRISKRTVDALTCPAGKDREILWDDSLSGFGVMAFASGRKAYVVQYRQAGRSRRSTIGDHGRLTPEKARSEAKKLLGHVEEGHDPIAERKAERAVPTFREIAENFMAEYVVPEKKARTAESYEALLRLHILPVIGDIRVTELRRSHLKGIQRKLQDQPSLANRVIAVFSSAWNWAAQEDDDGLFPNNPSKSIKQKPENKRKVFLNSSQFASLSDALIEAETTGLPYDVDETKAKAKHAPKAENRRRKVDPYAIAAVRLLIFTGARLREILHARWDEIDFERGLLNLSDSKTGEKSITLSAPALAILNALPRIEGNPHVIVGEGLDDKGIGKPRADLKKPWAAITKAAGLTDLRIHDLRHSFASIGAGAGMGLPIVGKLLGHTQPATTARYAHLDNDPLHRAANQIGEAITAAMERKPGASVVPMRKTKS